MSGRWTKAQRAKYEATLEVRRNGGLTKDKQLVRLAARLIRALPDEKLIQMVKE